MGTKGGRQPGAGRPKGKKNQSTIDKEKIAELYKQKILANVENLYNKQLQLANGVSYLYKITKYWEGNGKNKVLKRRKPKLVEDRAEIEAYLQNQVDDGDMDSIKDTYYYFVVEKPDGRVINQLLDRAIGTAIKSVALTDPNGKSIFAPEDKELAEKAIKQTMQKTNGSNKPDTK